MRMDGGDCLTSFQVPAASGASCAGGRNRKRESAPAMGTPSLGGGASSLGDTYLPSNTRSDAPTPLESCTPARERARRPSNSTLLSRHALERVCVFLHVAPAQQAEERVAQSRSRVSICSSSSVMVQSSRGPVPPVLCLWLSPRGASRRYGLIIGPFWHQ